MNRTLIIGAMLLLLLQACADPQPEPEITTQHYTYRAIAGVSMGGGASASIGFSSPERWDFIGILGAPLVDFHAFGRMLRRSWLSGFCPLETLETLHQSGTSLDSTDAYCGLFTDSPLASLAPRLPVVPEAWVAPNAPPLLEFASDYNNWFRGPGGGRGGSFSRAKLFRSVNDIFKAHGNPLYAGNPEVPWAAPGVTSAWLSQSESEQCANPVVLESFYNAEYNPRGEYDVLTFCEGQEDDPDSSADSWLGRILPSTPRNVSVPFLLAVDINGNGRRDYAEPVIHNSSERYQDYGSDGLPDALEPDYDPTTNPDPAGDNWSSFTNPEGTEGNYWWDIGEPYSDHGLDGVGNTNDLGENNGEFDRSPAWEHASAMDPHTLLQQMPKAQLERLQIYMDSGIRDFLNTTITSNRLFGLLQSRVSPAKTSQARGFNALGADEEAFDPYTPAPDKVKQYTYVRYGDLDATGSQINAGNGNHVGTADQAINRTLTAMSLVQASWPRPILDTRASVIGDERYTGIDYYESVTLSRTQRFSYILPPGYFDPENAEEDYPVLYFLHGQGQKPDDLTASGIFFQSAMSEARTAGVSKWAKFIIVFPNGVCDETVCDSGNFWTDFASGKPEERYRTDFYELMDVVDERFRTRSPEDIIVED